jgi:GTPase KRas protein
MAGKMTLYKLVVLGDGGVGKTALTIQVRLPAPMLYTDANPWQLCLNHFVETYDPTIEDSYRKQVQIDSQSCMLEVLDTAGQEEYIALRDQWIRDGEGFVLVYSISSRSSFARIQRFHSQIQRVKETAMAGSPTYPGSPMSASTPMFGQAPVMLVGNKCDRVTEREVSTQEGQALAKDLGCDFVEASAKNCVNVEKAFFDVVRQLRRQRNQGGRMPPDPSNRRTRTGHNKEDRSRATNDGHRGRGGHNSGRRPKDKPKCVIL